MNTDSPKEKKIAKILELVKNSEISSIKEIVSGLLRIIDNPKSSAKDLKDMIELDPPLTAKLLKLANSAYFTVSREITRIEEAVILWDLKESGNWL